MKTKLNNQKRQHGFTIIEVMIVLAIAGLILAVILLAVPTLQRTQRNNARQSDATHVAGLVADYVSNHGGQNPAAAANCNIVYTGETFSQLQTCKIVANGTAGVSTTDFVVDTGASCVNGGIVAGSTQGQFAVAWLQETSGSGAATPTCVGA